MKGKRIVVTRASHQAAELSELLRRRGAEPLVYPCIAIAPPHDPAALDAGLRAAIAGAFDWLVLTSTNTALALAQRLAELGLAPAQLDGIAVAAVGPATAAAAQRLLGLPVRVVPETYVAESLAATLRPTSQMRILLAQADLARPILAQELTAAGANVTTVAAYRTVLGSGGPMSSRYWRAARLTPPFSPAPPPCTTSYAD
jgi:uroporphyrinogen-III synthase